MKNVYAIYFSPGGTTKTTVQAIARSIPDVNVIEINLTKMENRQKQYAFTKDDLVIFGILTGTKMYGPVEEILQCLKPNGTPLIGVVMYGNGAYGCALKDMKTYFEAIGFKMAAAGAFIGQYSFTDEIAKGRPDKEDLKIIEAFGKECYKKILQENNFSMAYEIGIDLPEQPNARQRAEGIIALPIKGMRMPKEWNDRAINEKCIVCRKCERHCPVQAIDIDTKFVDIEKCIGCNGCTNVCPTGAIQSTSERIHKMVAEKIALDTKRREPQVFY